MLRSPHKLAVALLLIAGACAGDDASEPSAGSSGGAAGQLAAGQASAGAAGASSGASAQAGSGPAGMSSAGTAAAGTSTAGTMADAGSSGAGAADAGSAGTTSGGGGQAGAGASADAGSAGVAGEDESCGECGGHSCCDGACVNLGNDILNCGECGVVCEGDNPFCDSGECKPSAPCQAVCEGGTTCCGSRCCSEGQICCTIPGPIFIATACTVPTELGTCPLGCLQCDCNAPETPIATPEGLRPIASLRAGDRVYSIDGAAIVEVEVALVVQNPVSDHEVVRVQLEDGTTLRVSAGHPLADGRTIGDLHAGERYEGGAIERVERVRYTAPVTYDILPASSTGIYFAAGLPLRSTLHPAGSHR